MRPLRLLQAHQTASLILVLLVVGLTHRVILLHTFWPALSQSFSSVGLPMNAMQLLPRELLQRAPAAGLLYLQMTPPLPNALYALLLQIDSGLVRMGLLLALQSAISIATSILMALLLVRMGIRHAVAAASGVAFMLWGDLVLMEYDVFGFLFHETLAMLLCMLSCHAALTTARQQTVTAAIMLGLTTALLALTRATFSYVIVVVIAWLFWSGLWRQQRLIAAVLLPVVILHGGWSLKNLLLNHHFGLATSTWGGANLLHGELARDRDRFPQWLKTQDAICDAPWQEMIATPGLILTFIANMENAPGVAANIAEADRHVAQLRGQYVNNDTQAARMFSACLQRNFLLFWWQNPDHALRGWWRSYQKFWQPLRHFAGIGFFPLTVEFQPYTNDGFHLRERIGEIFTEHRNRFLIFRPGPTDIALLDRSNFTPAPLFVIPALGSLISLWGMIAFHLTPLAIGAAAALRKPMSNTDLLFPLLMIAYVAVLTSIIEYPENMRFRLAVEPVLWVVGLITVSAWFKLRWPLSTAATPNTASDPSSAATFGTP